MVPPVCPGTVPRAPESVPHRESILTFTFIMGTHRDVCSVSMNRSKDGQDHGAQAVGGEVPGLQEHCKEYILYVTGLEGVLGDE